MMLLSCIFMNTSLIHRRLKFSFLRGQLIPETFSNRGNRTLRRTQHRLLRHPGLVSTTNLKNQEVANDIHTLTHPHPMSLREAPESIYVSEVLWDRVCGAASVSSSCSLHLMEVPPVSFSSWLTCAVSFTCSSHITLRCSTCRWDNKNTTCDYELIKVCVNMRKILMCHQHRNRTG